MEIINVWEVEWKYTAEEHYPGRTEVFIFLSGQRQTLIALPGDRRPPPGKNFQVQLVVVPAEEEE